VGCGQGERVIGASLDGRASGKGSSHGTGPRARTRRPVIW
jgi:hypothetical protein